MINKNINRISKLMILRFLLIIPFSLILLNIASATPVGPTITVYDNSSKPASIGTKINSSINGTISPGGYIFTISLDGRQQNTRWKAFVGNVTGTFALDDADSYTMYEWSVTTVSGEVYATRSKGTINWSGINCTWVAEGVENATVANRIVEEHENHNLSHTNPDDNITSTFSSTNHPQMEIGNLIIPKDQCFAIQTWQNDAQQTFSDSDNANFSQVILWDSTNTLEGNIVYATNIESDKKGYNPLSTFDFQMIVPENGALGFNSATPYYFYVELS